MQNRPTKHDPQLSTDEYQAMLLGYAKLMDMMPTIKTDVKNARAKLSKENMDTINFLNPELSLLLAYEEIKQARKSLEHRLIFHSQNAITNLHGSKSGLFGTPTSSSPLKHSQEVKNTSKSTASKDASSDSSDSQEYRSLSLSSSSSSLG